MHHLNQIICLPVIGGFHDDLCLNRPLQIKLLIFNQFHLQLLWRKVFRNRVNERLELFDSQFEVLELLLHVPAFFHLELFRSLFYQLGVLSDVFRDAYFYGLTIWGRHPLSSEGVELLYLVVPVTRIAGFYN